MTLIETLQLLANLRRHSKLGGRMQSSWQRGGLSDPVHALAQLTRSVTIQAFSLGSSTH
jgi:hypothetical protein